MDHEEILHRCFRCGFCKLPSDYSDINCPAYLNYRFESFSPGGRMWLIRAWLQGDIQGSTRLQESLFSCATCNNCVQHCPFTKFKDSLLQAFIAAKEKMIDQGTVPPRVRDYLTAVYEHGNPYKRSRKKRGEWAQDLEIPAFAGQEYLLFVGDVASFDPRAQEIARAVVQLFRHLNVSFGMLGSEEISDGNEAKAMGESELFAHLARKNIHTFSQYGVQNIVTLSPHSYNALHNDYPQQGGSYHVLHYTQLLAQRMPEAGREWNPCHRSRRVTFHDPCYLGRHNHEFEGVRSILEALPGVDLVEISLPT